MKVGDRCELLCLDLDVAERLRRERAGRSGLATTAERSRALGELTRLELALALREAGELCVCDLAWIVERSQNLVSQHLRTLRTAGLVSGRRDGKMVMYALTAAGAALVHAVVSDAQAAVT